MIKKILLGGVVVIITILVLLIFFAIKQSTDNNSYSWFSSDFMTSISDQVLRGLDTNKTSPVSVKLEDLGEISPFVQKVEIVKNTSPMQKNNLKYEYIAIKANKTNTEPINISNWSLKSLISDVWIGLPQGAEFYEAGIINPLKDIYLQPGDTAYISSEKSPVESSFRVNECSGFLNAVQDFEPRIKTACFNPSSILEPTVDNIRNFGDRCVAFVENFNSCSYLTKSMPSFSELSPMCKEYLQPRLTYNYCKTLKEKNSDFYKQKEWRIFLNQNHTLWKTQYETILLLDDKNRTVDVITY